MKKIFAFIVAVSPLTAFAQIAPVLDVNDVTVRALSFGDTVIYILVALAVIFIVYNVVFYLIKPNDSAERTTAGLNILWGIVGLFIIVSIWGLVNIFTNSVATVPTDENLPNLGMNPGVGGIPANAVPIVK